MSPRCKSELRKRILAARDALAAIDRSIGSAAACRRLLSDIRYVEARSIHLFHPFGSELDTRPLIGESWLAGKTVVMPETDAKNRRLVHRVVSSFADLAPGYRGILEPLGSCEEFDIARLDLVVVPGCCFDRFGGRMGYGGGFYDRFLGATQAVRVALAFDEQVVASVPRCDHDLGVDALVTPGGVVECDRDYRPPCIVKIEHP